MRSAFLVKGSTPAAPPESPASGLAATFQAPKLIVRQTLMQNVETASAMTVGGDDLSSVLRLPGGIKSAREARALAREVIAEVGLTEYADEPISRLPHGLRRLGEVARSLAMNPGVLLLDEPASRAHALRVGPVGPGHSARSRAWCRGAAR